MGLVESKLVTVGQRRSYLLHLSCVVPVGRCCYGARVSRKAYEYCIGSILLPHKLTDVELAARAHFGRACIAEVRVVGPNDDFRVASVPPQMSGDSVDGLHHVRVAQVPGGLASAEH